MNGDAFSNSHPAVNFSFFIGAIVLCVITLHPMYLVVGGAAAAIYYLLLNGRKGWNVILGLLSFFLVLTCINPLFNTQGERILFHVFGRPYTFEALLYGGALAGIFVVIMLWFGCCNAVMTGDKFTSLFGNLIPSLSLLLVMVLRMIPNLIRKAGQISGARRSVGKGESEKFMDKVNDGMTVLGALTSLALEGGVATGDSMRGRGYGCAKRSSFQLYRMTGRDWMLACFMAALLVVVVITALLGGTEAAFTPELYIAPVAGVNALGLVAYLIYSLIPTVLHIKEAIQWHISRSRI